MPLALSSMDQKLDPGPNVHPRISRIKSAESTMLTTIEPRHPSRLEKNTNTYCPFRPSAESSVRLSLLANVVWLLHRL